MGYMIENKTYAFYIAQVKSLGNIPHLHTHLELIYLMEGEAEVRLDNRSFLMRAGDVFLAFPNQVHSYHMKGPVQAVVSIFSPELHKDLEKLVKGRLPLSPVLPKDQLLPNTGEQLLQIIAQKKSGCMYGRLASIGNFLVFLSELLSRFQYQEDLGDYDSMLRLLEYCSQHFQEPIGLKRVSEELFLNPYYISHLFRKRMNLSFHQFISYLRIHYVCELLEKNMEITQAAFTAGFSSVRTFNRVFLKIMGQTPREYVRRIHPE